MVIVVVFEDRDDQTGANVTVLVYQLEEDVRIVPLSFVRVLYSMPCLYCAWYSVMCIVVVKASL